MRKIELVGKQFGRLVVMSQADHFHGRRIAWLCECECGRNITAIGENLRSGRTASCGCIRAEIIGALRRSHGRSNSREYRSWSGAKDRCYNKNSAKFMQYGGRGIRMCDNWLNSFETFLADMGQCPTRKTLDRIDVNGPYAPENCRWATNKEQMNNRQYHVRVPSGETLKQYAERTDQNYKTLHQRLRKRV